MAYSIKRITTAADCDALLMWAEKEKAELTFKKLSEDYQTTRFETSSLEIEAILKGVLAELKAADVVLDALPDGPTKEDELKKKVKLEYKKFLLENRKVSYGVVALLQKELDLQRVNNELEEVEEFLSTITAHKTTL
ncbi:MULTISPECIES: hypothetical protein [unclassified Flavobacterium]|uniref:hypothetical protein n=1 Tax=unclassified Flavobacterium TaxID=196869 RepID=UPI00034BE658|nr:MULTISPECIES: hypothetical protein [unclassified Flavobacterium]URC11740.1 hypothetical protein M4I44_16775 [Flavobacterium sp. B183]